MSSTESDNDTSVPPLEDLSHMFSNATISKDPASRPVRLDNLIGTKPAEKAVNKSDSSVLHPASFPNKSIAAAAAAELPQIPPKTNEFSGLKRGFFASSTSQKKHPQSKTTTKQLSTPVTSSSTSVAHKASEIAADNDDIPFLRGSANTTKTGEKKLSESLRAMFHVDHAGQGPAWMDARFWTRISESRVLAKAFTDPNFLAAAKDLERNPQEAFKKYGKARPEYLDALRELSAIIGEQLMTVADEQEKGRGSPSASSITVSGPGGHTSNPDLSDLPEHERQLVQRVLSNPETQSALKDPVVQRILAEIRANPPELARVLAKAPPQIMSKIRKLMECGLLQIQH